MPVRVNQRAVEARERKAAAAAAKAAAAEQEAERKKWEDNDKLVSRKLDRKAETQAKAEERMQRKLELRKLAEEEMKALAGNSTKKNQSPTKLTRAQILQRQLKAAAMEKEASSPSDDGSLARLEPNINHIMRAETLQAQLEGRDIVSASNLDDALSQLAVADSPAEDRHPERRMRAAYRAYEEQMMPRLKAENPTLKRSQLLELLSKQWKKAPENPLNQAC
ncbi:Coiled-coil domain-containing protein 124, related [Eimeria acervulina]|uniref:Coiled-coil domain-containing protein 124, related n=1 Tax=Eimeria acervulina TaxID=5801 RepID=U6GKQ7_EIMAC|nr:Coiled-coil domain-containing protein 124, related [Eimeria acervulina]CDI79179.1 Coiled-coil domain-containing protein 124, related [Eimeria acervulina]